MYRIGYIKFNKTPLIEKFPPWFFGMDGELTFHQVVKEEDNYWEPLGIKMARAKKARGGLNIEDFEYAEELKISKEEVFKLAEHIENFTEKNTQEYKNLYVGTSLSNYSSKLSSQNMNDFTLPPFDKVVEDALTGKNSMSVQYYKEIINEDVLFLLQAFCDTEKCIIIVLDKGDVSENYDLVLWGEDSSPDSDVYFFAGNDFLFFAGRGEIDSSTKLFQMNIEELRNYIYTPYSLPVDQNYDNGYQETLEFVQRRAKKLHVQETKERYLIPAVLLELTGKFPFFDKTYLSDSRVREVYSNLKKRISHNTSF